MVRYTANGTPSEDDEEEILAQYCDLRGWRHTHFSNETYTTSWKQKAKMKKLGVHSGVPDHLVIVPRRDRLVVPVYIEMKREKGGTVSDEQFKWIKSLKIAMQFAAVCEGGREAIEYLDAVEKKDEKTLQKYDEKFDKMYEKWGKKQKKQKNDCPF